jgi:hypothetical protein
VIVPGHLASRKDGSQDFRGAIPYKQRLGTDGARVALIPDELLADAITAGQTVEISVDLNDAWQMPGGPAAAVTGDLQLLTDAAGTLNVIPTASANDQHVTLPTASTTLTVTTADTDGTIASRLWTKVSGPNNPTLTNDTTATVTVGGATPLIHGTYIYQCLVTDDAGGQAIEYATIVVDKEPMTFAPSAAAHVQLPTSTATLTPTGVPSYAVVPTGALNRFFELESGPNVPGGSMDDTTLVVSLTGLVYGTYLCRWRLTDIYNTTWYYPVEIYVDKDTIRITPPASQQIALSNPPVEIATFLPTITGTGVAMAVWNQVSGGSCTISTNPTTYELTVEDLLGPGEFLFRLTVQDIYDDLFYADTRLFAVEVEPALAFSDVGKTIFLPTTDSSFTVVVTDPDADFWNNGGTVEWGLFSGPNVPTLTGTDSDILMVSGCVEGVYVFVCIATNEFGQQVEGYVTLTVLPEPEPEGEIQYVPGPAGAMNVRMSGTGGFRVRMRSA